MFERISLAVARVGRLGLEDVRRDDGQTTVEYAIIIALVIGLAVAAFAVLDPSITSFMSKVGQAITNQLP